MINKKVKKIIRKKLYEYPIYDRLINELNLEKDTTEGSDINSSIRSKYKISRCFLIIHMILLLFMGLRGSWVGIDTIVYSQTFENATSLSAVFNDDSTTEPLYKIFMFIKNYLFFKACCYLYIFCTYYVFCV